jgi:hypothetical protein
MDSNLRVCLALTIGGDHGLSVSHGTVTEKEFADSSIFLPW